MERRALRHAFYKSNAFKKRVEELNAWEDVDDLKEILDANPDAGDVIPGGSGIRKIRMPLRAQGKGSRGGARVIYFQVSKEGFVLLLYVYAKNEAENLTRAEVLGLVKMRDLGLEGVRKGHEHAKGHPKGH